MGDKENFWKITGFSLVLILLGLICIGLYNDDKSEVYSGIPQYTKVYYGDNVAVSDKIAKGYECEDYIPRSVSINKERRLNG